MAIVERNRATCDHACDHDRDPPYACTKRRRPRDPRLRAAVPPTATKF